MCHASQEEVAAREAARSALRQLTELLGARSGGSRQHRILEGPTVRTPFQPLLNPMEP